MIKKLVCRYEFAFFLGLLGMFLSFAPRAAATAIDLYFTQAGGGSGASCASALSETYLTTNANWGTGSSQIGPGTTVHLCGPWTYAANGNGLLINTHIQGGTSGHVLTIQLENATIQSPAFHDWGLNIGAPTQYVHVTCVGTCTIQDTDNGSPDHFTYQVISHLFEAENCQNCEIDHLLVINGYVHDDFNDINGIASYGITYAGDNIHIHDNTFHDVGVDLSYYDGLLSSASDDIVLDHNDHTNYVWGADCGSIVGIVGHMTMHDEHYGSNANWDSTGASDAHKNAVHCFSGTGHGIQNLYLYNNTIDGDWGTCCTTSIGFFLEGNGNGGGSAWGPPTASAFIFNNVFRPTAYASDGPQNGFIAVNTGSGSIIANNTIIGIHPGAGLAIGGQGVNGTPQPQNVTLYNNTIEGVNSPYSWNAGVTFLNIDYNFYANASGGNAVWQWGAQSTSDFTTWKANCTAAGVPTCDAHSQAQLGSNWANLNTSSGIPSAGFVGLSPNAKNLSSIATGALTPLATGINGTARGSNWDGLAYQLTGGGGGSPAVSISCNGLPSSSLAFGGVTVNVASSPGSCIITNSGTANLVISSIVSNSAIFALSGSCASGCTVTASGTTSLSVVFTPLLATTYNSTIDITSNASSSVDHITVTGTGVAAQPAPAPSATTMFAGLLTNQPPGTTISTPSTLTVMAPLVGTAGPQGPQGLQGIPGPPIAHVKFSQLAGLPAGLYYCDDCDRFSNGTCKQNGKGRFARKDGYSLTCSI